MEQRTGCWIYIFVWLTRFALIVYTRLQMLPAGCVTVRGASRTEQCNFCNKNVQLWFWTKQIDQRKMRDIERFSHEFTKRIPLALILIIVCHIDNGTKSCGRFVTKKKGAFLPLRKPKIYFISGIEIRCLTRIWLLFLISSHKTVVLHSNIYMLCISILLWYPNPCCQQFHIPFIPNPMRLH